MSEEPSTIKTDKPVVEVTTPSTDEFIPGCKSTEPIGFQQRLDDTVEYVSPFERTVMYRDDKYFETTAALLSTKAQIIPMFSGADKDAALDMIPYLTPQMIFMGSYFTKDQILKCLQRGFQSVQIFIYNKNEANRYFVRENDELVPFDKRVSLFGMDEIYDVLNINCSLISTMLMEYMTVATFPSYQNNQFPNANAQFLLGGIQSTGKPFSDVIIEIGNSWKGYQLIEEFIMRGKIIGDVRRQIAEERVARCGVSVKLIHADKTLAGCAVPTTEFIPDVKKAILGRKSKTGDVYQVGVVYRYEPKEIDNKMVKGYYLGMSSAKDSKIDVCALLKELIGEESVQGDENDSSGWAPTKKVYDILTFLAAE